MQEKKQNTKTTIITLLIALLLGGGAGTALFQPDTAPATPVENPTAQVVEVEEGSYTDAEEEGKLEVFLHFRKPAYLEEHYEKHGKEMGFTSKEEYLVAANVVINNPNALHKTEKEDGDDVYYLESTNEFVIVSTDGYLRTYFYPADGLAYFNRQ